MHQDPNNQYRPLLAQQPPEFIDRVDTPWDAVPDLPEYNAAAYRGIERDLDDIHRTTERFRSGESQRSANSRGILILGEAGSGKTHLLMRAARRLAASNHILFVRKPNNVEAVAQHIWANIVSSLARRLGQKRSQLDDLLAHVFCSVLIAEFESESEGRKMPERHRRQLALLRADPFNLFNMLGQGRQRQSNLRALRRRTLGFLQEHHPDVDQHIARVLITYCLIADDQRRRVLLTWLSGEDIGEEEARLMGLPSSWIAVDDSFSDLSIQQQREEQALRAIYSIGILSTHYQPLLLSFDQLEGLRGDEKLTQRWGDVVREIFTMAPNFLIVTCIFPSLWESWFTEVLDESATQRIGQRVVELEVFAPQHGMALLKTHLQSYNERHKLPDSIYPFSVETVVELCNRATSPRMFLQLARQRFEAWLDGDLAGTTAESPVGSAAGGFMFTLQEVLERLCKERRATYVSDIPLEQDMLGRIRTLVQVVLQHNGLHGSFGRASFQRRVIPANFIIKPDNGGEALCVAVLNADGAAFATRLRNLLKAQQSGGQFRELVVLRDHRSTEPGSMNDSLIQQLRTRGGALVLMDQGQTIMLDGLYDLLTAIEEHDLSIDDQDINKQQFTDFFKMEELGRRLAVFAQISSRSMEFAQAAGVPAELALQLRFADEAVKPVAIVVGDTRLDSPHIGVMGDLKKTAQRLAISLSRPQGIALLGDNGSAKTRALGVLIENALLRRPRLIRQSRPMCVLVFNYRNDPDAGFDYADFARANDDVTQIHRLHAQYGAEPVGVSRVNVFAYEPEINRPPRDREYQGLSVYPLQFRSSDLGSEHWEILMKPPAEHADYMPVVRDIIRQLFFAGQLTLKNLESYIATDRRFTQVQRHHALNRLDFAQCWINDKRTYEWSGVLRDGVLNVFDLRTRTLGAAEVLKLCLLLSDIVRRTHNGVSKLIVFDEAHDYFDCRELAGELENMLIQLRLGGVSFALSSQVPEAIPEQTFRHLRTRFIFKLPARSINYLRRSSANLATLVPQQVTHLDAQQATGFVQSDDDCSDVLLRSPQLISLRPLCTHYHGAGKDPLEPENAQSGVEKADEDKTLGELCKEFGISLQRLLQLLQWPDNGTVAASMKLRIARMAVTGKMPAKSA